MHVIAESVSMNRIKLVTRADTGIDKLEDLRHRKFGSRCVNKADRRPYRSRNSFIIETLGRSDNPRLGAVSQVGIGPKRT